jgi:integrase
MRDIYTRHRPRCRYAQADYESKRGTPPRQIFGCGCPIYARVVIRDPVTKDVLFQHNGSLKGVTVKEAAEELVNNWFVKYLSGEKPPIDHQKPSTTIEEAVGRYINEKRNALPPAPPALQSDAVKKFQQRNGGKQTTDTDSIRKIADVLKPLVPFMASKGITYLKDVKTEHLTDFQQTWKGQAVKNPKTGERIQLPKSQHGKAKYQEYLKGFFKRCRLLRWIDVDPAELLEPVKASDPEILVFSVEDRKKLVQSIETTFPKTAAMVKAFMMVQAYSALRLSDVVSLEVASIIEENGESGIHLKAQRKTDAPVFCALPPAVVAALSKFAPKSPRYFFWTGNGQLETASKDWSAKMLRLFRAAGFPEKWQGGPRSHHWRDTMAMAILESEGGTLEHAQIALGHKTRRTTEKYYTALTKKRTEPVTEIKRKLWSEDELLAG